MKNILKIMGSNVNRPTNLVIGIIIKTPVNICINDIMSKNPEYLNVGLEYKIMDMLCLRLGKSHSLYDLDSSGKTVGPEHGLSFGTGIKYQIPRGPLLNIDYVFSDFGVFNNIQGYSISLNF